MKPIHILTNFERFPQNWQSSSYAGTATLVSRPHEFIRNVWNADLIIVNCDVNSTLALGCLFTLCPFFKRPTIAVDLILRRPEGLRARIATKLKKYLFRQVDLFINYFRDLKGYDEFYGISPQRSSFVHFKANLFEQLSSRASIDGEYVLCFGQSLRDYDTFFEAISGLPFRGAIPKPNFENLRAHGSRFSRQLTDLPGNVMFLEDDGSPSPDLRQTSHVPRHSPAAQIRMFENARMVVIPILSKTICASGVGTYMNAMLLGKCVIISEGPGVSDVVKDQVIVVPPEDPTALREAIRRVWEDVALREATVQSGRRLAELCGGEQALMQRVLDTVIPTIFDGERA